ncbi:CYFA0S01e05160g1_1 [Cyberlindnera fabianii]|uniref:Altered inheritance of mitochondria protein 19, mitochondrial n=1 Tax=Cyberlindnera fabianii TaxID=36022 RepID=A0A061AQ75_CYBFA|nr:Altered inheritance of mitochondria protein 19, mitochondrial [Cyberlindnera fabianii]CDR36870.1 CYFA0S01e05160g1_1 [Cyberlindnera fabianii]
MVEITELKDEAKQQLSKVDSSASFTEQLYQYSQTPYPSWILSGMLLATPFITSQPQAIQIANAQRGGMSFLGAAKKRIGPSNLSSLLFGGALALGGWIIQEGDVESGTGFITAWSSLYLVVSGRSMFNGIRYGRVWPVLLATAAGTNAYIHGKRFFFTSGTV